MATADPTMPDGLTVTKSDASFTIVDKHRDQGDIFSLFFLGLVVVLFASMIGGKTFDWPGAAGALLITLPLWGWLWLNALRRTVNSRTVVVTPGTLAIKVGPVPGSGSETLSEKDIGQVHTKSFENISSTRGATKPMITKSFSVWVRTAKGTETHVVDELDTEEQARFLVHEIERALKKRA